MDEDPPTSDLSVHSSRDLGGADALAAAEAAVEAFDAGDQEDCLAHLDRAERAVRAVAKRNARGEAHEHAHLTLRSVEAAVESARSGVGADADDAGTRLHRAAAAVRHAVHRFDPGASSHRALDGPG